MELCSGKLYLILGMLGKKSADTTSKYFSGFVLFCFFVFFLSHLLVAGCDIGV